MTDINSLQQQLQNLTLQQKQQQEFYNQTIAHKNAIIDDMRIKLKRYEFAVKEAILFLGRPIVAYNTWLASPTISQDVVAKRKGSITPQQMAEKQHNLQNASELLKNLPTSGASNLEIQCFECIRVALNYLTTTLSYIQNSPNNLKIECNSSIQTPENQNLCDSEIILLPQLIPHQQKNDQQPNSLSNILSQLEASKSLTLKKDIPKYAPNIAITKNILPEEEDGDLAVKNPIQNSPKPQNQNECLDCRKKMIQNDHLRENIKQKDLNIQQLKDENVAERASTERMRLSKDILEQELEELTEQLFEQANSMVIEEAHNREDLEIKNNELKMEISSLRKRADARDDEIKELKKIAMALRATKLRTSSIGSLTSLGSYSNLTISGIPKGIFTFETPLFNQLNNDILIDGIIYSELQDYIGASVVSPSPNSQSQFQTLNVLMNTNFMRRCMTEDIDPCLFNFNYNFSGISKNIGSGGMSSSMKKKLLDYIMKGNCELKAMENVDTEKTNSKHKCSVCTIIRECQAKIKLQDKDKSKSEELIICQACRDRVAAVVDFFSYVNFLRQSKHTFSILNIFRCFIWLKRRLANARIGSCSLFEQDFASIASSLTRASDWEQDVHIQN